MVRTTLPVVASGSGSLAHLQMSAEVHTCGGQKETARTRKRQRSWLQEQTGAYLWHLCNGKGNAVLWKMPTSHGKSRKIELLGHIMRVGLTSRRPRTHMSFNGFNGTVNSDFCLCGLLLFPSGKNHFGRRANWRPADEFHTEVELVHPTLPVVASGSGSLVHLQLSAEVHTCGGQKETARTQKRQRSWLQEQTGTNLWHLCNGKGNAVLWKMPTSHGKSRKIELLGHIMRVGLTSRQPRTHMSFNGFNGTVNSVF